ncbi:hypothetical protein OSH11_13870 [Kaistia dalseonensis]|uniref:Uncharacterized protein n=1 Tax=Kaistia dalseonensis TaxID=410840 RepID=A0ABU0H7V6_9HYPH|nr:hypothetical protein [Kaistia dalseonensis]MCX5495797.1 hypothetical protein [Kaistia dalseonensis]MDQ0438398.1 hypothetical protein [Kaistia dalseonensis]
MAETAEKFAAEQRELDRRVDLLIASHNGDLRAAMETILICYDDACERSSSGFSRGRIKSYGL